MLEVHDTGAGIPPEIRDKIFNLYFTTKKSGSGIGLALTYRAMQLHNGALDLDTEAAARHNLPLHASLGAAQDESNRGNSGPRRETIDANAGVSGAE